MAQTLGICVATRDNFKHVLGIAKAAHALAKKVEIFFTGDGVHCTQIDGFADLLPVAKVAVCEVSYIANGYKGIELPGLADKDFMTQARHAEMVEECDRYITL